VRGKKTRKKYSGYPAAWRFFLFLDIIRYVMFDIFKTYKGSSLPKNPLLLTKEVLSHPEDKELQEFYWFFLALNADRIKGHEIYEKLAPQLKPRFIDGYNRAYLLLRTWGKLVGFSTKKKKHLPNLFLPKKVQESPFILYKTIFDGSRKRMEKRWREILNLY
jgi:hypothetical protein